MFEMGKVWFNIGTPRKLRVELNIFHYNAAINVCQKCGAWDLAMALFDGAMHKSIQPDCISYNAVMGACGEAKCWELVLDLLSSPKKSIDIDLISFNTAAKTFDRWGHDKT